MADIGSENLRDFRNFLYLLWKPKGWNPSPQQYRVAEWLQGDDNPAGQRRILSARREFGKSELAAAYAVYRLYWDSQLTVLIVSGGGNHAARMAKLVKSYIQGCEWLAHMDPRRAPRNIRKDGAVEFNVGTIKHFDKDHSVASIGITGMITGRHPKLIIPDDIETTENSETALGRAKLINKWGEFEDVAGDRGEVLALGTPQNEDSTYFVQADLEGRGDKENSDCYELIRVPSEYPDLADAAGCDYLAPWLRDDLLIGRAKAGDAVDPERLDKVACNKKRARQGESRYALQMLLNVHLANANLYPLRVKDFIVLPVDTAAGPESVVYSDIPNHEITCAGLRDDYFCSPAYVDTAKYTKWEQRVMYIDPSGSGDCQTGIAIGYLLNGKVHVPFVGGLPGGYYDGEMSALCSLIKEYKVSHVLVESDFGAGGYRVNLMRYVNTQTALTLAIDDDPAGNRQKEVRIIEEVEPLLNQHKVVVDPRVARSPLFIHQFTRLTKTKGCLELYDQIDAFAGLMKHFRPILGIDGDHNINALEESRLKEQQELFLAAARGEAELIRDGRLDPHRVVKKCNRSWLSDWV